MPFLELDHMRLHWREDGEAGGPPLVFANSLGTDLRLWDHLLPHLPPNTRKIRFDLRGHGRSSSPVLPYSLDDLTSDTAALLDALHVENAVLIGTSLGGMIAQALAVSRPELVTRLILTNTAPKMGDPEMWAARCDAIRIGGLVSIADDVMRRWFGARYLAEAQVSKWRAMLLAVDPDGYIGCCEAIAGADLSSQLCEIGQETLVVGGAEDLASPPDQVEAMADKIPDSAVHLLSEVGHLPSIEAPQALAGLINPFLKGRTNA